MTAHRRPEIPFGDAPRGVCRWCGEPILHARGPRRGEPNARRRWHPACVVAYNASDPREARRTIRKRDRGVCAICRLDTYALRRELRGRGMVRALRERGFKPRKSLWELDHVVPLIDGGSHDLANLQTLCTPCHKQKTAQEARERAARARDAAVATDAEVEATPRPACAPAALAEVGSVTGSGDSEQEPRTRKRRTADLATLLERATHLNARVEASLAEQGRGRRRARPGATAAIR